MAALAIASATTLSMKDWKALVEDKNKDENKNNTIQKITTPNNGRTYNVEWNGSDIKSIKRYVKGIDASQLWNETQERGGYFTDTTASVIKKRFYELAAQEKKERPQRDFVQTQLEKLAWVKTKNLKDIDDQSELIELKPQSSPKQNTNDSIRKSVNQDINYSWGCSGRDISRAHNAKISKFKESISKIQLALHDRLHAISNSSQLPVNLHQQQIERQIEILSHELMLLDHIHAQHQKILNSYFAAINSADSPSVQHLWNRTKALSNELLAFTNPVKTVEEKKQHSSLLKKHTEIAGKFVQIEEKLDKNKDKEIRIQPALKECCALLNLSIDPDELPTLHKAQLMLASLLKDHTATWEQINVEMTTLSEYKAVLEDRSKKINEVAQFINDHSQISTQQTRLHTLIDLADKLSGDSFERAYSAAKRHMLAIRTGAKTTAILNKLRMPCVGIPWANYNPEKQARINSLIAVESMCLGLEIDLNDKDIQHIANSVEEHGNAINKGRDKNYSDPIASDLTYEKLISKGTGHGNLLNKKIIAVVHLDEEEQKRLRDQLRNQNEQLIKLQEDTAKLIIQVEAKRLSEEKNQPESEERVLHEIVEDRLNSGIEVLNETFENTKEVLNETLENTKGVFNETFENTKEVFNEKMKDTVGFLSSSFGSFVNNL